MTLYKTKRNSVQFATKIHPRIPGAILGKLRKLTALKRQDAHYLSDFRQTYITVLFFVDRVSVLLEHVHRISKAYVRFTPDFLSFFFDLLSFWQAPQPLQHSFKSESITGQLRNQSSRQNFRVVLGQLFL